MCVRSLCPCHGKPRGLHTSTPMRLASRREALYLSAPVSENNINNESFMFNYVEEHLADCNEVDAISLLLTWIHAESNA